jgi:F-type H+-transporting ATPase subunit b
MLRTTIPTRCLLLLALWAGLALAPAASRGADPAHPAAPAATADASHPAAAGAAPAHGGGRPNILEFQPTLAFWTLIVFLVLMAVLWKFAWGPLSKALHEREHQNEHALAETERARADAERLLAEHRRQMEQAQQQVQAMLDDARRTATASADEIRRTAQAEAETTKQRALSEIGVARDQALTELWSQTANLAVSVAGKVLDRELSPDDHRRLIAQATAELPAAPANGNGFGRGGRS